MGNVIPFPTEVPAVVECKSRKKNDLLRGRKYLTKAEIEAMISALPKWSRTYHRDQLFIRMSWRHAYRLGEILDARWSDIDWNNATITIRRTKGSLSGQHDLDNWELRKLKDFQRKQDPKSVYIFTAVGKPHALLVRGAQCVIEGAGKRASLPFPVHHHSLRHSSAVYLLSQRVDVLSVRNWLGHKDISKTLVYCSLMPDSNVRKVSF
jgi:integrase